MAKARRYGGNHKVSCRRPCDIFIAYSLLCFPVWFLDDTRFDDDPDEPALNVNGDLEVYLPEGSQVAELIKLVEDDWSTNVMIIYVESGTRNITDQRILQEMSYVENQLNPYLSDSINDDVIYILSLSTVLKEVNSSAPRVREAFINELGQLGCAAGGGMRQRTSC